MGNTYSCSTTVTSRASSRGRAQSRSSSRNSNAYTTYDPHRYEGVSSRGSQTSNHSRHISDTSDVLPAYRARSNSAASNRYSDLDADSSIPFSHDLTENVPGAHLGALSRLVPDEEEKHIHPDRRRRKISGDDILLTPSETTSAVRKVSNLRPVLEAQQARFRREFVRISGQMLPASVARGEGEGGEKLPKDIEDDFVENGWPVNDAEEEEAVVVLEWTRQEMDAAIAGLECEVQRRRRVLREWGVWRMGVRGGGGIRIMGWMGMGRGEEEAPPYQPHNQRAVRTCARCGYPHYMAARYGRGPEIADGECVFEVLGAEAVKEALED
ncbi:uncharacterized protein KY384_004553 [Bacidia gigantensis]|uniref:uncharacterized protein n=1 Tax=Bacidia gigantensis TaxID=2732470 RepID=UPI001D04AC76|nr:uncharacterized protein KY384_004553 [Bacidia gigantensis]KAG8531195.1 hypothetical protein KY384_004553 [Bacidia gigantensis]